MDDLRLVIAFAALSGPLPKAGVVAVALLVAVVLLAAGPPRPGAGDAGGADPVSPVLLLTDIWSSPQLGAVHRHPLQAVVAALLALACWRRPRRCSSAARGLVAPLAVLALPFRVPIQSGPATSNLLVPLYFVVAAGALAWIWTGAARPPAEPATRGESDLGRWVQRLLALSVVLYGIQGTYVLAGRRDVQDGPAERGLLLRAVRAAVPAAARPAVGPAAAPGLPAGDRRAGDRVLAASGSTSTPPRRSSSTRSWASQRPAHLLHRQLGVL